MADWLSPKTDWSQEDGVLSSDLNRIEGNTQHLKENLLPYLKATVTYYVSNTGNDSNDGLSEAAAFATIQKAIDSIPKNLNDFYGHIVVAAGSYAGFTLESFYAGIINISNRSNGAVNITSSVDIRETSAINISGFSAISLTGSFKVAESGAVTIYSPTTIISEALDAVRVTSSKVSFGDRLTVTGPSYGSGISTSILGEVYAENLTINAGTGTGIKADVGGRCFFGAVTNNATVKLATARGGRIYTGAQTNAPNY